MLADTIFVNPSLLAFQPVGALSGTYSWINDSVFGPADSRPPSFNVSVIDGKNEYVNAGLAFTRRPGVDFLHLSLAKRALQWLSFGSSVKYFSSRGEAMSPYTATPVGALIGTDMSFSTSFLVQTSFTATPIQIGIVGDNLIAKAANEPLIGPRQVGIGFKANLSSILLLYGDAVEYLPKNVGAYPMFHGGIELAFSPEIFLRGGIFGTHEKGWSLGGGWVGPKLGFNYGYQSKMAFDSHNAFEHALTVDFYM